ncbi:MAG: hypothetical protein KDJ67_08990 [Nitratireductor sp.]|nr:hypothetical protein [Nitratireductor sp.]
MIQKIFEYQIRFSGLFLGIFFCVAAVKALTFLPDRYYFSFSKVISGSEQEAFFVRPPGIDHDSQCAILNTYKLITYENLKVDGGELVYECAQKLNIQLSDVDMSKYYWEHDFNGDDSKILSQKITQIYRDNGQINFWISFLFKLLPPAATGLILSLIYGKEAEIVSGVSSAATAFIMVWPVIIFWDVIVNENWDIQKNTFFLMYSAYIILYFYTARFFAVIGNSIPVKPLFSNLKNHIDWPKILTSCAQQIATAAFAAGITIFAIK